jgi:hypothetical protein
MLVATARPLRAPVFARRSAPVYAVVPHSRHWNGLRPLPQVLGEPNISDESRGGLEGGREVATKDKGGSKSRKKAPAKTLKQKRQTKKAKQAVGTAK